MIKFIKRLFCKHEHETMTNKENRWMGDSKSRFFRSIETYTCDNCGRKRYESTRPEFPPHAPPIVPRKKKLLIKE